MNEQPWLCDYPNEVPQKLEINDNKTLIDILEEAFSHYKNLPMVENMGKVLNYKDVDRLSKNFASYIQNFTNLKPGDHVAIQLPNILQYPITAIGLIRSGMVLVSLNPLYTSYEMENQLIDAKVKAIVILENFAHKLANIIPNLNLDTIITTSVGDMFCGIKKYLVNFTIKYIKKLVPKYSLPQAIKFTETLKLGAKAQFIKFTAKSFHTAVIQYTGGTTGVSKGAMLTHNNLVSNVEQMKAWVSFKLKNGKETMVTALPFYHIFAFTINLFTMIKIGAHNVLITNPKNIKNFVKELKKHKFTCFVGVSTLFNSLLSDKNFLSIDFSYLKAAIEGGMSLSDNVAIRWEQATGTPLIEAYGLTEASPAAIANPFNGKHKLGTIGLPLPNTDAKIVDKEGSIVPYGTPGDLLIRGPQVMKGYWGRPEETADVLRDGWLNTGDIAVMNEEGFIKIVDRKKDVINVSGFNVYPNEIEEVVYLHPSVYEVAAIGVPYDEFKDAIKLFIVKSNDSLSEDEILQHCRKYLTAYKIPKYIEFRSELPKSNVGKILRRVLKEDSAKKIV
jgi:long-chain acyl-CoA synthetase